MRKRISAVPQLAIYRLTILLVGRCHSRWYSSIDFCEKKKNYNRKIISDERLSRLRWSNRRRWCGRKRRRMQTVDKRDISQSKGTGRFASSLLSSRLVTGNRHRLRTVTSGSCSRGFSLYSFALEISSEAARWRECTAAVRVRECGRKRSSRGSFRRRSHRLRYPGGFSELLLISSLQDCLR